MSQQDIHSFNLKHYGKAWIMTSGTSSHFMSGECLAVMLEQVISPALQLQRKKHRGLQQVLLYTERVLFYGTLYCKCEVLFMSVLHVQSCTVIIWWVGAVHGLQLLVVL